VIHTDFDFKLNSECFHLILIIACTLSDSVVTGYPGNAPAIHKRLDEFKSRLLDEGTVSHSKNMMLQLLQKIATENPSVSLHLNCYRFQCVERNL
jgi:hypothetical protein